MCTALEKLKQDGVDDERKTRILKMLSKGYAISEISEIFDISEDDILKIKEGK